MPERTDPIAGVAVQFVDELRRAGVDVPVGSTVVFYTALAAVDATDRAQIYWTGRATLLCDPTDIEVYDRVFAAFWGVGPEVDLDLPAQMEHVTLAVDDEDGLPEGDDESDDAGEVLTLRYSPTEVLREKDFADYTDDELDEAQRLMGRLAMLGATRACRRRRTVRRGSRPALRPTVRQALRTGGEPVQRWFSAPRDQTRRLILLLDVSGSMESYARALIRFVHAAVVGRRKVEVFTMGTRLTRITRELSSRDPDAALAKAADVVEDWSGGTRLGAVIGEFNDRWGVRGMARGAVVVILSDGWDRGDPAVMAEQMTRLQRVAHRVVWVNPLKASPGYEPLAQGMAAALPHVDDFVEGHNLDSLETLAEVIAA